MLQTLLTGLWTRRLYSNYPKNLFAPVISIVCLLMLVNQPLATENGASPPDVFKATSMPGKSISLSDHVVSYQPVLVDYDLLASLDVGSTITLNLMLDASYVGTVRRVQYHSEGSFTLSGFLESDPNGDFIISVVHDVVAASIRTSQPIRTFQVRYVGDGVHIVGETEGSLYPPDADARIPQNSEEVEQSPEIFEKDINLAACSQEKVFDLMIVYTAAARSAAGGTSSILALALVAVEETNEAYNNSQISHRIRLVHCEEVGYSESGNTYDDHLDHATNSTSIASTRTIYGADLVSMWVHDEAYCGMGSCYDGGADKGYSVVHWDCATGNYSQAHEMGHNQGCAHDRDNASGCNFYSYSYGWRFTGDDGYQYRTVMAYKPGTRIKYLSNPDVIYQGQPTGIPIGDSDEANNAETIRNTASTVRAFRPSVYGIWVDFANTTSPWNGTYSDPYLTVAQGLSSIIYGNNASEAPTLWIVGGSSTETPTFDVPLVVKSCSGSAIIGD